MEICFAKQEDLERINELRAQVNLLHVKGKPEVFKPGFPPELRDYVYAIFNDPRKRIVVCKSDKDICAFAVLSHITKPETPFTYGRDYLDIDEFCVNEAYRRQGIGTQLMWFIRDYAKSEGLNRIELNMWEFNENALAFYESVGFVTYRRYMELKPDLPET